MPKRSRVGRIVGGELSKRRLTSVGTWSDTDVTAASHEATLSVFS